MLRSPRELPAMIVALAVGVGLTAAAYSLIDAVLLTPLPYSRPERLVQIWNVTRDQPDYRVLLEQHQALIASAPSPFQGIANYRPVHQFLERGSAMTPVELDGAHVSANTFDVLGVRAARGRTFEPGDGLLTSGWPIIVSERLVQSGLVSGTLGDVLRLDGERYRLVGIMPATFWFPDRQASYWAPLPTITPEMRASQTPAGGAIWFTFPTIARLADGVQATAAESLVNARVTGPYALVRSDQRLRVASYADALWAAVRPSLLVVQGAAAVILLLVCLNVAWLFVARARRLLPACATMRALGATSRQVLATHLVSAVCVAIVAAPCAVLLAWLLLRFGLTFESGVLTRTMEPATTWRVISLAFVTTVLASVVSCLPGAFTVARWNERPGPAHPGLAHGGSYAATPGRRFERPAMTAQLALVFAAGAHGVLIAFVLFSLSRTNVGLSKTDFLVVTLTSRDGASVEPRVQLERYEQLLERLDRRGIRAAASNIFPLTPSDYMSTFEPRRSRFINRSAVRVRVVTPSYFEMTGLRPTSGRLLTAADAGTRRVVVTDAFATRVLQGRPVIGGRAGGRDEYTIVGMVPGMRHGSITEEALPEVYMLYDDFIATTAPATAAIQLSRTNILAVPTRGTAATMDAIRQEVADLVPNVDVWGASHMRDLIDLSLGINRLVAAASIVFGTVALLLAALGVYAMVRHGLALRAREIGIRMALGATARRIALESIQPIAVVYIIGVCVGVALLLSARSAIQSVMVPPPGVTYPSLTLVIASAAALLVAALVVACYRPITAASRTDLTVSLRVE